MKQSSAIHLRDLADISGLSQAYFSRAFKASTGMAPRRWHLTERVRRAQQIMLETGDSLAEVALASGFADQSHFTRAFRDITGQSPGAWRRVRTTLNSA
jgi:transcriptional regulator GlxA family with amidase domain